MLWSCYGCAWSCFWGKMTMDNVLILREKLSFMVIIIYIFIYLNNRYIYVCKHNGIYSSRSGRNFSL